MGLQILTGQTITEPVTLAELKDRLSLATTDDDAKLTKIITAAREFAERISGRSLAYKSYQLFMDRFPWPHEPIRMDAPPLVKVTAIKYFDTTRTSQTWDAAEYWVTPAQEPALIMSLDDTYPSTARVPGAVEVDFNAGYGYPGDQQNNIPAGPALPESYKLNVEDIAVFMYENAGTPPPPELVQIPKVYVF